MRFGRIDALATLALLACSGARAEAKCRPVHGAVDGAPVAVRVEGTTPDGLPPTGRLVLSWLAPPAAEAFGREGRTSLSAVMPFIRHAQVYEVALPALTGGSVRCPMPAGPPGARVVGLLEVRERFWSALMGGGPRLVGAAGKAGAPVTLSARGFASASADGSKPSRPPQPSKHCAGPRFVHLTGDDPAHHACALLPKDHDARRRYPAIYMLSGLSGDDTNRFGWDGFVPLADAIAEETGPALYIGVNSQGPAGSIYPTEAGSKAWLDWLAGGLAKAAEARLGAAPEARGLMGQSTGGFNAMSVAMLRPGAFRSVAVVAPDALDMGSWLLDGDVIDPRWLAWMRLEVGVGGPGQMVSYAAAWSPDKRSMPADLATGAVRRGVLKAWLTHSPYALLGQPAHQGALRGLDGRLHIVVADNDPFDLAPPARHFAARLKTLGIDHRLVVDEHGHFGLDKRLPGVLRAMRADLAGGLPADGEQ